MQVATILPTPYLHLIEDRDYHMALAHLIGKDAEYTKFYRQQSERGAYVILDNSVIEDAQQTIENICMCAEKILAKEIILPDVFRDCDRTLHSSLDGLEFVKDNYPNLRVMAVPQGSTIEEWLYCAEEMLSWPIDVLGIPKVLVTIGGRDARMEVLHELGHKVRGIETHLLGCWYTPIECTIVAKAIEQKHILPVRGVDSAIAYVYAREGMLISQGPRPSGAVNFAAHDADEDILKQNIDIWESSVDVSKSNICRIF